MTTDISYWCEPPGFSCHGLPRSATLTLSAVAARREYKPRRQKIFSKLVGRWVNRELGHGLRQRVMRGMELGASACINQEKHKASHEPAHSPSMASIHYVP